MAPRKSIKSAAPEAGSPAPEPAVSGTKPRGRKKAVEAAPALLPVSEPMPEAEAAAPARKKTRAAKAAPAPEAPSQSEAAAPAPEASPAAVPAIPAEEGGLLTVQARAVLQAIHDGRAVELLFADAEANPPRTFEPRQLIYDTFAKGWYVWGWDRRYNAERHHRLDLIAQVGPVEGVGRAAQGPYKEGTPANLIGGWLGGEPIRVKAVLLKQWIFAVRQAPAPFPEFLIEEMEEGKAQVTFTGTDLRAIARWAMQFGDGIQVLEPQRLQDRIKQVGVAWGGKAAAERPAAPPPAPARQPREHREHRESREPKGEGWNEHKNEHKGEHKNDQRGESREMERERERRPQRPEPRQESSKSQAKPGKFEIRIDRL